ncbi:MAG: ABC transporter ATP-binding protein [Rhodobacterales bacterium]|nr:ABC transporter ATP-binding protein [Rhodobacterales bacterium]
MGAVTLTGVRKLFGTMEVIKGIDLAIADRELVVFVGPSGCGKSTLLRMIAGLEDVDYGAIEIAGRDVTELAPALRGVAMVFQNYALYPHMTAYDNMAYGLRRAGLAGAEVDKRVRATAAMLQITELLPRRPKAMSGGQRQRVAIGRAIVRNPEVFMFDEPLSNLDAALRVEMRSQIARLHRELQATMIFVTHDQVEAMTLADRIVVLNGGRIEQVGTPREVYHRPANIFVAGFIGSPAMNLLPANLHRGAALELGWGTRVTWTAAVPALPDNAPVTLGVRPERVSLCDAARAQASGEVTLAEHLGDETILHLKVSDGVSLTVKAGGDVAALVGDRLHVAFDLAGACLFGPDGRRIAPD